MREKLAKVDGTRLEPADRARFDELRGWLQEDLYEPPWCVAWFCRVLLCLAARSLHTRSRRVVPSSLLPTLAHLAVDTSTTTHSLHSHGQDDHVRSVRPQFTVRTQTPGTHPPRRPHAHSIFHDALAHNRRSERVWDMVSSDNTLIFIFIALGVAVGVLATFMLSSPPGGRQLGRAPANPWSTQTRSDFRVTRNSASEAAALRRRLLDTKPPLED